MKIQVITMSKTQAERITKLIRFAIGLLLEGSYMHVLNSLYVGIIVKNLHV